MKRLVSVVFASVTVAGLAARAQSPTQKPAAESDRSARSEAPVVRERRVVVVNGKSETWELQWESAPVLACPPDDPGWFTCPCEGFAFGESGILNLVRLQGGREVGRLSLTPRFANEETPAWKTSKAVLRRWPVLEKSDFEAWEKADSAGAAQLEQFKAAVLQRKSVPVLDIADFNQDGWSTEFVLQIGVLPCGKRQSILVGVSPDRPQLHVFSTAEHPETALVLLPNHWEKLKAAKGPFRVVSWACGDHGSEEQTEITLWIDRAGIHAVKEAFSCEAGREHGDLVSREEL